MKVEDVSIVVIPRDRFSMALESLESLLVNTPEGYSLIYVDARSPRAVRERLDELGKTRPLNVLSVDHYLPNNHARNLGLSQVRTPFVVFIDNDMLFTPGWLEALMRCAEETGADVTTPLICEGFPPNTIIHIAGGEYVPAGELKGFHDGRGRRRRVLRERQYLHREALADWHHTLERMPTGFGEMHCILIRRDMLDRLGDKPFDEGLLATKEHIDFCMSVRAAGGTIWFEPESVVTFMLPNPDRPLQLTDVPFYMLRWSDEWQHRSLDHLVRKWDLGATDFSRRRLSTCYRRLDVLRDCIRHIPLAGRSPSFVELAVRGLRRIERHANRRYVRRNESRHPVAVG